jgi:hypothetical protein
MYGVTILYTENDYGLFYVMWWKCLLYAPYANMRKYNAFGLVTLGVHKDIYCVVTWYLFLQCGILIIILHFLVECLHYDDDDDNHYTCYLHGTFLGIVTVFSVMLWHSLLHYRFWSLFELQYFHVTVLPHVYAWTNILYFFIIVVSYIGCMTSGPLCITCTVETTL